MDRGGREDVVGLVGGLRRDGDVNVGESESEGDDCMF